MGKAARVMWLIRPMWFAFVFAFGVAEAARESAAATAAPEAVSVQVPSLDPVGGPARNHLVLPGHWFVAASTQVAVPALVLLHGCGGNRDGQGGLARRYTELAAHLNSLGVHALVVDSLTPRGEKELCTQKIGNRRVTQLQRRRDALGALQWLAEQPRVDAARIGVLGWSNGGSTVLAATNQRHPEVARATHPAKLAIAYYPGCEAELQRGYVPVAPLLMLLGEADDWTPAAPCKALAASVTEFAAAPAVAAPLWEAYPGAHHGFDSDAPLRLRRDVPSGVNPGQGVHVGGNPEAKHAAARRLEQFLRQHGWASP